MLAPTRLPPAFLATLGLLAMLLAWDASGLDIVLAQAAGTPQGFPLRDHWLLAGPLHNGARWLAWALALALCLGAWWPVGALARLEPARRLQLAVTTVVAAAFIASLKSFSVTSCPWDLQDFGGTARYLSHWSLLADGGAGRCFPAGHASSGFAFLGGWFAWRDSDSVMAAAWLAAAVLAGLGLGLVQQWRGAHFMSHTLWTGWLCWCVAYAASFVRWG
ncbi:MAG: phosphatase PAP2 family protein [Burkholderiales bacterium]|nr:phosphatase PAP2 family protein [Burkholderiales bacterium]